MMTMDDFRRIALSLPETEEKAHMGHPDFRVRGKIFATLWPEHGWGMVKLSAEQQQEFMHDVPVVFAPVKGGWGRQGATLVLLQRAPAKIVRRALVAAWCKAAPKKLAAQFEAGLS